MSEDGDPTPGAGTPSLEVPPTVSYPGPASPTEPVAPAEPETLSASGWTVSSEHSTSWSPVDPVPSTEPWSPADAGAPIASEPGYEPMAGDGADDGRSPDLEVLALPLARTAALVGEYRWIEQELYRLLGQWVTEMPLAAVQVHLDGQSLRHAWHAELWAERLPVHDGADPVALTAPSPQSAVLLAALWGEGPDEMFAEGTDPGTGPVELGAEDPFGHPGALPRLAGLYRVALPRLVTSYERHLGAVAPVTDGPVARALRLVLNDEIEDWRAGERLVQRLVTRPHDVVAVHEYLQRLEAAVVGAGAVSGLVTFPDPVPAD